MTEVIVFGALVLAAAGLIGWFRSKDDDDNDWEP